MRENAWCRKRAYKKKLVRRFLSVNPALDITKLAGAKPTPGVYIAYPYVDESGKFYDWKHEYSFNPYEKIYLSARGDFRKYHGIVYDCWNGNYSLARKGKRKVKQANRRIRYRCVDEEGYSEKYSFYKKKIM